MCSLIQWQRLSVESRHLWWQFKAFFVQELWVLPLLFSRHAKSVRISTSVLSASKQLAQTMRIMLKKNWEECKNWRTKASLTKNWQDLAQLGAGGGGLARSWSPRSRLFTSLLLSFNTYWSTYISYYKRYSTSGKSKHDWKVPTFKYSLTLISSPGLKFVTGGRVKNFQAV